VTTDAPQTTTPSTAAPAPRPEVLAPAGDHDTLYAALAAGADAVYFGLDDGFNARARATNFATSDLDTIVRACHRAGARAFLTLNTLVFEAELPVVEAILRRTAASGVDALIVQDPAVALLAARVAPALRLHASTQMTISSPEGARFAAALGVRRVVLPRELSAQEVGLFRAGLAHSSLERLELEVFVHGALCMSWSGQCLTSEAWGGRSANRGQCAQSCRLPYDLQVDGALSPTAPNDPRRYLLSPSDLAGHEVVPDLLRHGVTSLKIEGRLKGPAYVTNAVETLRRWVDAVLAGQQDAPSARQALAAGLAQAHRVFSRGFTAGFLLGGDHRRLVDGRHPKHRGAFLGRVLAVDPARAEVTVAATDDFPRSSLAAPLPGRPAEAPVEPQRGMGVVFDLGDPEATDEPGGPLFHVQPLRAVELGPQAPPALRHRPARDAPAGWRLGFARDPRLAPDLGRVHPGHRVWVNSDPTAEAAAQRALKAARARPEPPQERVPVRLEVHGRAGQPLRATFTTHGGPTPALQVTGHTDTPLAPARGAGLTDELLRAKLGALGGTPFQLDVQTPGAGLDRAGLPQGLYVAPSALKRLRRALVAQLTARLAPTPSAAQTPPAATGDLSPALPAVTAALRARAAARLAGAAEPPPPQLIPLCRQDDQLDAALALGFPEVELDWMEMVGLGRAVARAKAAGARVVLATPRVQKPGEEQIDHRLARLQPHGVLVRHWGGLMWFADGHGQGGAAAGAEGPPLAVHGDFSLNVTNSLTFWHLLGLGLGTVTASHDLDEAQLFHLLDAVEPARLAVVVHHHVPTFHTEHCVYAANLSDASPLPPDVPLDRKTCGQPCERHQVSLVDPKGFAHPVIPDVFCRNTVFEARAQSAAGLVPRLLDAGVRRFRVELVRESGAETATVLGAYRDLLRGRATPREVVRRVAAHEQFGVVRGVAAAAGGKGSRAGA